MPGFAGRSDRERAYREGIRIVDRSTGRLLNREESTEIRRQRRKENGDTLYRNSASVPDSLVHFADEIHREDRITRSEEIELGEKTQEALRLQTLYDSLEAKLDREPTDEEWCAAAGKINMESIRQAIDDGLEAKNKLVTSNLRMVQSVVNTYIRNGLSARYNAGDMMQEGIIALIRAAEKFEPGRGPFVALRWKSSVLSLFHSRFLFCVGFLSPLPSLTRSFRVLGLRGPSSCGCYCYYFWLRQRFC
jgi:DNA-directed RNA polymerase sigma subunit (sigma70/sigma32)